MYLDRALAEQIGLAKRGRFTSVKGH